MKTNKMVSFAVSWNSLRKVSGHLSNLAGLSFFLLLLSQSASCSVDKGSEWDYLGFTQQWPETVCTDSNITHKHKCAIGRNVTTWTIHGVWPTKDGKLGPNYCNNSRPFDENKIKELEPLMLEYWPNLYTDSELTSFWKHEWVKHGTCAASHPAMASEYGYFSTALKLNRRYDLFSIFENAGIVPSDTNQYKNKDIVNTLLKNLKGKPKIQCYYEKSLKTQFLAQIMICLDRKFNVIDCGKTKLQQYKPQSQKGSYLQPCRDSEPVAYPKLH